MALYTDHSNMCKYLYLIWWIWMFCGFINKNNGAATTKTTNLKSVSLATVAKHARVRVRVCELEADVRFSNIARSTQTTMLEWKSLERTWDGATVRFRMHAAYLLYMIANVSDKWKNETKNWNNKTAFHDFRQKTVEQTYARAYNMRVSDFMLCTQV